MCGNTPSTTLPTINTVGIVAKTSLHEAASVVREVAAWLERRNLRPIIEEGTAALAELSSTERANSALLPTMADLILVLGGDGTLLGVARQIAAAPTDTPILAVNFGGLGFLTEITLAELFEALATIVAGNAKIDERRMLRARIIRGGETLAERHVLNDVVITKGALSGMLDLSVSFGDQFVTQFRADGLIVSTPTGSTAYNLSVGGPIVHPVVQATLLTPIAPHMLTNRPVLLPDRSPISIEPKLDIRQAKAFSSFDGQTGREIQHGDIINVETSGQPLRMIRATGRPYFAVLREKLRWTER